MRLKAHPRYRSGRALASMALLALVALVAIVELGAVPIFAQAGPALSINDVPVAEGSSGTVNAIFTVSLPEPSSQAVTVDFTTADVTATAASDYVATTGTLHFPAGTTSQTIIVQVFSDALLEPTETFVVNLANPTNAIIADGQGQATIIDPGGFRLTINDVSVKESTSGTVSAVFMVTLSEPGSQEVTVDFTTIDATATAGSDYVATAGTLRFPAGTTSQAIVVLVSTDALFEPAETFVVNLANPANAAIADGQGQGTIIDRGGFQLWISDASVTEGSSGTVTAVFTVTLSEASEGTVSVDFDTDPFTARDGPDYAGVSGRLTFAPGTTSQQILVEVFDDTVIETDETFRVSLFNPTNADLLDSQAVGTILDNDFPTVSISDARVVEGDIKIGDSTGVEIEFVLRLSRPSPRRVFVRASTADGTATSGSSGSDRDFDTRSAGVVSFAPRETATGISGLTFALINVAEPDETFFVNLSHPDHVTIADGQAKATIVDNDERFSISDATGSDAFRNASDAVFTVSLSGSPTRKLGSTMPPPTARLSLRAIIRPRVGR